MFVYLYLPVLGSPFTLDVRVPVNITASSSDCYLLTNSMKSRHDTKLMGVTQTPESHKSCFASNKAACYSAQVADSRN